MTGRGVGDEFGHGSLTDVAGIHVGHADRSSRGWLTGTTVVFAPHGMRAAADVAGGAPGTREIEALRPGNLVTQINAICLTGGSAFGLAAADGVVAALERRSLGVRVGPADGEVVPVVPAAVIFDLGRGGSFHHRPTADFGQRALATAGRRPARGSVGAGLGARAGGLRGGIGMASTTATWAGTTVTVAALAVVNAAGSAIDPVTGLPYAVLDALRRPVPSERRALATLLAAPSAQPANTTIGVIATDADVGAVELQRLSAAAHDGMARAIRPIHLTVDGDVVFACSTAATPPAGMAGPAPRAAGHGGLAASPAARIDGLLIAAAEVFERACADAVVTATTSATLPAYRDVCRSAYRRLGHLT